MIPDSAGKKRSFTYFFLRIAERFGLPPFAFYELPREQQIELLAYEIVREEEEAKRWQSSPLN